MKERKCGVLLPVSSLPSRYGIGSFSREAYDFVDFLKSAGQSYWQILPLGQTGYGDSPYQSFSTFAGNPYFIDLDRLVSEGYLEKADLEGLDFGEDPGRVSYEKLYRNRLPVLYKAYQNSPFAEEPGEKFRASVYEKEREAFLDFCKENEDWLPDYALYSAVKKESGGKSYIEWEEGIRRRESSAMKSLAERLHTEIRFYQFLQFIFRRQWTELKDYANEKGLQIIGDIPIYVAFDSADTWSHPELFKFDENGYPTVVSGCPPYGFSATGQLWGNPIYRWDYHRETGYAWWLRRLAYCYQLYDVVRIDHFRGFDEYYEIPYGETTARNGKWMPGPGYDFFDAVKKKLGQKEIIAEDLGYVTESVCELVRRTGYPGMKVLQFAFDSREESDYYPHNYPVNCVVYTGTHDNDTVRGWYRNVDEADRDLAERYIGGLTEENAAEKFIRTAMMSVGRTAVIPMQDYLNLGTEARINTPSTLGGNWIWRMKKEALSKALGARMREFAETYGRL